MSPSRAAASAASNAASNWVIKAAYWSATDGAGPSGRGVVVVPDGSAGSPGSVVPSTGLPMPLVSYGGSSTLATVLGIAICCNIGARREPILAADGFL